jgi:hypothetical protein
LVLFVWAWVVISSSAFVVAGDGGGEEGSKEPSSSACGSSRNPGFLHLNEIASGGIAAWLLVLL